MVRNARLIAAEGAQASGAAAEETARGGTDNCYVKLPEGMVNDSGKPLIPLNTIIHPINHYH